jgi:hypothetical protein
MQPQVKHFHGYARLSNNIRWLHGNQEWAASKTVPWIRSTLQKYQMVAWQPRMGDLNNRKGSAFYWVSQML